MERLPFHDYYQVIPQYLSMPKYTLWNFFTVYSRKEIHATH